MELRAMRWTKFERDVTEVREVMLNMKRWDGARSARMTIYER